MTTQASDPPPQMPPTAPATRLEECLTGSWMTQAICVAAELRLADLLADGPRSSDELARLTKSHAPSLHRLLRALTTIDVCRAGPDGSFALTPVGAVLRSDTPDSLRSWALWWGRYLWPVWGNLLYSVRTGRSARTLLTAAEGFAHLERDPEAAQVFYGMTVERTRLLAPAILGAYDFSGLRRIVDVGGGWGELLVWILRGNPQATGVLFERPEAQDGAVAHLAQAGLSDRCEFVAGDFFSAVPAGADAYVVKSVLHDWKDERARQILVACRRAMEEAARLIVIEQVLPPQLDDEPFPAGMAISDLTMLTAFGAQERTEEQFRDLLRAAGLRLTRVLPAGRTLRVLEAKPDL